MQNDTVVGFLADALSCVVTEERNGLFELPLTYPVTGALFDKLQLDRFVKAKPNDSRPAAFPHLCGVEADERRCDRQRRASEHGSVDCAEILQHPDRRSDRAENRSRRRDVYRGAQHVLADRADTY